MSRMAPPSHKKRKLEDGIRGKTTRPKKRFRKQYDYRSSEDEEDSDVEQDFKPISLADSDAEAEEEKQAPPQTSEIQNSESKLEEPETQPQEHESQSDDLDQDQAQLKDDDSSSDQDDDDDDDDPEDGLPSRKPTSKRNDPTAFSTSISKILSTKLPTSTRADPVLSRSREAHSHTTSLMNTRLEKKVKAKQRAEKKASLEKGRVTDVLGLQSGTTGEVAEEEKRLRKIAQRGVVKLFNAVRAAQVRAEQAAKEEQKKGTVGMGKREDKAKELSKDAFLNMINGQKGKTVDKGVV